MKLKTQFACCELAFFPLWRIAWSLWIPQNTRRESLGMVSLSSSNRLPAYTAAIVVNPVMFPQAVPGCQRTETNRIRHLLQENDGDIPVAFLGVRVSPAPPTQPTLIPSDAPAHQPTSGVSVGLVLCISILESYVLTLNVTSAHGTLAGRARSRAAELWANPPNKKPIAGDFRWLLRLDGKAKRREQSAIAQGNEFFIAQCFC